MRTINDFLEPWKGPEANDLLHKLAEKARPSSEDSRRYEVLGQTKRWHEFDSTNIGSNSTMRIALDLQFAPQWQAWLPDLARVIHNERQLEHLYHSTLITRVNIALQRALSSENQCVTIVVCPGSFDSYDPHSINGKETVILPDWIAIEGTYSPLDVNFPYLETLARKGKIVAVGDTKLVRQPLGAGDQNEGSRRSEMIDGTHSCRRAYLAQVQHYARMLLTRYAFVLTNTELVLAQFLRETEAAPRLTCERGLRSVTGLQLVQGVSSDFRSPEPEGVVDGYGSGDEPSHTLQTPQPRQKRRTTSSETPSRPPPAATDRLAQQDDRLAFSQKYDLPSSPPRPYPAANGPVDVAAGKLMLTPSQRASGTSPSRAAHSTVASPDSIATSHIGRNRSSSLTYAPSERDNEIGDVLVQSFRIPNPCDEDSLEEWQGNRQKPTHPAKALFALLMLAYLAGPEGRRIDTDEIGFENLPGRDTRPSI